MLEMWMPVFYSPLLQSQPFPEIFQAVVLLQVAGWVAGTAVMVAAGAAGAATTMSASAADVATADAAGRVIAGAAAAPDPLLLLQALPLLLSVLHILCCLNLSCYKISVDRCMLTDAVALHHLLGLSKTSGTCLKAPASL